MKANVTELYYLTHGRFMKAKSEIHSHRVLHSAAASYRDFIVGLCRVHVYLKKYNNVSVKTNNILCTNAINAAYQSTDLSGMK